LAEINTMQRIAMTGVAERLGHEEAALAWRVARKTALAVVAHTDRPGVVVDTSPRPFFDRYLRVDHLSPEWDSFWQIAIAADWSVADAVFHLLLPAGRVRIAFDLVDDHAFLERVWRTQSLTIASARQADRTQTFFTDVAGLGTALRAAGEQQLRMPRSVRRVQLRARALPIAAMAIEPVPLVVVADGIPADVAVTAAPSEHGKGQSFLVLKIGDEERTLAFDPVRDRRFLIAASERGLRLRSGEAGGEHRLAIPDASHGWVPPCEPAVLSYADGTLTLADPGDPEVLAAFLAAGTDGIAEVDVEGGYVRVGLWADEADEPRAELTLDLDPYVWRDLAERLLEREQVRLALLSCPEAVVSCTVQEDELAVQERFDYEEWLAMIDEQRVPVAAVRDGVVLLDTTEWPVLVAVLEAGAAAGAHWCEWTGSYEDGQFQPLVFLTYEVADVRFTIALEGAAHRGILRAAALAGDITVATDRQPDRRITFPVDAEQVRKALRFR
jgi:hypothetical protein